MSDSESSSELEYDDDFNEISYKEDNLEHKIAGNKILKINNKMIRSREVKPGNDFIIQFHEIFHQEHTLKSFFTFRE